MTLLMALAYFIAGILCIHRPERLKEWIAIALNRVSGNKTPSWLQGNGIELFIRLIGFLSMFNAITLFYSMFYRH